MTELEKRMWEDDIKFITKLREEKEELQRRINETIKYLEPFVEIDMCTIKGTMLKKPLEVLKGQTKD